MTIYDPAEYVFDLRQWLYSKRGPFPGFQFAAMQLPCLQGLWLANMVQSTPNQVPNLAAQAFSLSNSAGDVSTAIDWPDWQNYPSVGGLSVTTGPSKPMLSSVLNAAIAQRTGSLTIGGWCRIGRLSEDYAFIWNSDAAGDEDASTSLLGYDTSEAAFKYKTAGGGDSLTVYNSTAIAIDTWYFVVGRYSPGAQVDCIVDLDIASTTIGVPAAIGANNLFNILPHSGTMDNDRLVFGEAWIAFCVVPDHVLAWLYKTQAPGYGK